MRKYQYVALGLASVLGVAAGAATAPRTEPVATTVADTRGEQESPPSSSPGLEPATSPTAKPTPSTTARKPTSKPSPSAKPRPLASKSSAFTAGLDNSTADTGRDGWRLVWNDEFTGASVDAKRWNVEDKSTFGDGNKELPCLLDRPENVRVTGGNLLLTARKEASPIACGRDSRFPGGRSYSSGHLSTRDRASWTYGRFEMRAKVPTAAGTSKGLWPAFWLRPVDGGVGELDVMEAIGSGAGSDEFRRIHQTIHYDYVGTHRFQVMNYKFKSGFPADGYHRYAAEWEPGVIRWYIDDVLTYTRTTSTTPWLNSAFSRPFLIRLNLAVGGEWPGSPDGATRLPAEYAVDFVRVYQR